MRNPIRIALFGALVVFVLAAVILPADQADAATPLRPPPLRTPVNGASMATIDQPVVFTWGSVYDAQWYDLQISADPTFASGVIDKTKISGKTLTLSDQTLGAGLYYWRVKAGNPTRPGTWSLVWTINVIAQNTALANRNTVPYQPGSIWNTPIAAGAPVDPNSSNMIGTMAGTTTGGKIYSETTQYTFPVYYADASTPRYDLRCAQYKCTVVVDGTITRVDVLKQVPIPQGAKPSAGTDAQMIIIDTASGNEFGLYHVSGSSSTGWAIGNGYRYNVGYGGTPVPFGARGAGVPYQAGLIRPWEIRSGEIRHALAFAYNFVRQTQCVYPATKSDGVNTGQYAIPYGARIQLNPALTDADFNAWGLSRAGKIVARALQVYGMFLVDRSTTPKIYAEDLTNNPFAVERWTDPDLAYTRDVIAKIPYNQLRVLSLPQAYWNSGAPRVSYGNCIAYP